MTNMAIPAGTAPEAAAQGATISATLATPLMMQLRRVSPLEAL